eukprot:TRINITY_DN14487_c0_g1_i9.p1 TRINITY_DN14487_c0_g1~~TRINITY_DN14487_c0_g1_i9.p1  ORF type:complete len:308 (+),score=59.38 TRINITY_DN14487_c0_g1_i9:239-1162(+)
MSLGASLLAFDFGGCGLSSGDLVSLGWFEKDQLRDVISHLRATKKVSSVALWGRSMGAATALMHATRDLSIAVLHGPKSVSSTPRTPWQALVLDSAFANLTELMMEVSTDRVDSTFAGLVLSMLRSTVLDRAGFDIELVNPLEAAKGCAMPALFCYGQYDSFVAPRHSVDLHRVYGGRSELKGFEGEHDGERPREVYEEAEKFLAGNLLTWQELPTHPDGTKVHRHTLNSPEPASPADQHSWLDTESRNQTQGARSLGGELSETEGWLSQLFSCFDNRAEGEQDAKDASFTDAAARRRERMRPDHNH